MEMEFKDWFCLKQRESFTIDAKINPEDARFYFGRQQLADRMRKQISRSFIDPQIPKLMIWGPYGCGKTQTLHHLAYWLKNNKPDSCKGEPHVVHLEIEVQSKSSASKWHFQNMEALGMQKVQDWLGILFNKSADLEKELHRLIKDPNIVQAFSHLRGGGDLVYTSWRWLCGQVLTARELQAIKVTRNLGDIGIGDLVASL